MRATILMAVILAGCAATGSSRQNVVYIEDHATLTYQQLQSERYKCRRPLQLLCRGAGMTYLCECRRIRLSGR